MGRKKLPDFGICSRCGRYMKLFIKGNHTRCRTCYDRTKKLSICDKCGRLGQMQGKGVCHYCYYSLGYSSKIIICEKCGKEKYHYAKGLCRICYHKISEKRWRERNPERFREGWKKSCAKWRAKNPERWKEIEHKANGKRRKALKELLPKRIKHTIKNVSFITSDGMGAEAGKIHAKCVFVGKFDENNRRIIVYEMPNSNIWNEIEKRKFKVQTVDIAKHLECFNEVNGKELYEKYGIKAEMLANYPNSNIYKSNY